MNFGAIIIAYFVGIFAALAALINFFPYDK